MATGGVLHLNKFAHETLGSPSHVALLFAPQDRTAAIKATNADDEDSYKLTAKKTGGASVSAYAYIRHYRIAVDKYRVRKEGDLLVFEVREAKPEEPKESGEDS